MICILKYEISEDTALAVFTEKVHYYLKMHYVSDLYDAVCCSSIDFGKALRNAGINILPDSIFSDVLKWVSGRKELPEAWLQVLYENFEYYFKRQITGKEHTNINEIKTIRTVAGEFLDKKATAEYTMFHEWHFLGKIYTSPLVHKLIDDYSEFKKFRHISAYTTREITTLISIGYALGVHEARGKNGYTRESS